VAKQAIIQLKAEQARGSYQTARYYEKHRKWQGALIYFNNVLQIHADSPYAAEARQRIEEIKQKIQATPPPLPAK
jgi:outer membrane protein assembly factor BamD (BamD/ComL family)